ncbi:hypothetical protein GCM10023201_46270 [Actinomycetospora corticicola]|uniref:Uncharacterized protein n=1 Tax=Actinomycetospora corticicola TaxID=663602 RepID=A0A7Y9J7Z2_9PSEU|nr:hypothetical protein [Actinomycetospora corticicola]NYD39022.1 hypothetical protein [Actinomycetospora corticicola]
MSEEAAAPEFEDAADELYGLHPDRFVPRRGELVKAAKAVKDKETATAIGALRKPSLGAWLANVLARESPDEVGALEELGGQLRHAQESLSGDALRTLTTQRRELVGALVARARKLAREDGEKVGDSVARDLEQTIAAALADPEAARAFAAGRLTTPLEPGVGFTGGSSARGSGGTTRRPPPRGTAPSRPAPRRRDEEAAPEPDDGPDPAEEERERAREAAERAVERAREERDDTARAAERARHRTEQAASDHDEAAAAARSLRERLERAEAEESAAREALDAAREASEEAEAAADEARRALDQAEAERADLE